MYSVGLKTVILNAIQPVVEDTYCVFKFIKQFRQSGALAELKHRPFGFPFSLHYVEVLLASVFWFPLTL